MKPTELEKTLVELEVLKRRYAEAQARVAILTREIHSVPEPKIILRLPFRWE